jgi:hypothetical protein
VAGVLELERAEDALRVGRGDACVGRQLGVEVLEAVGCQLSFVVVADLWVDRRAQIQVGERGAQVEAGAADDDRAAALFEQLVDRRVRLARIGAGRVGLGDGQEPDQAVLEPLLLVGGRGAAEDLQAVIDLDRVG